MSRTERRPQRYTRSSTTSVTQLLSDSCSSLLARLTTRSREEPSVRLTTRSREEPSARQRIEDRYERHRIEEVTRPRKTDEKTRLLDDTVNLGSTRSRLEDKYSDVLEKYVRRKKELQKAESPLLTTSARKHSLSKSATTASVLLAEKAYPFVATQIASPRDKTPFRATESVVRPRQKSYKDKEPETNHVGHTSHSSQPHAAHRRRRSRAELSEKPSLKLCPIDIEPELPVMSTRRLKDPDVSLGEVGMSDNSTFLIFDVT